MATRSESDLGPQLKAERGSRWKLLHGSATQDKHDQGIGAELEARCHLTAPLPFIPQDSYPTEVSSIREVVPISRFVRHPKRKPQSVDPDSGPKAA